MEIFFSGGPLDGTSRRWDGEFPEYLTFAQAVQRAGSFQRGYVYEKSIDNIGVELGSPRRAEYLFLGDTAHGQLQRKPSGGPSAA
jgi:hypothetical protein